MPDPFAPGPTGSGPQLQPPQGLTWNRRLIWLANGLLIAYAIQAALVQGQIHPSPAAALLALSAQLSDQAFLALLAVALLQLTSQLAPSDQPLRSRCRRNLEGRLLSSLLLLLIPLQLLLGWGELKRLDGAIQEDTTAVVSRLRDVRGAILSASTRSGLVEDLARLQAPPLPPELLSRPLPQLKRRLLSTLAVAEQRSDRGSTAALKERSRASGLLVRRVLQTCLLCLLYAISLSPGLVLALQGRSGSRADRSHWQALAYYEEHRQELPGDRLEAQGMRTPAKQESAPGPTPPPLSAEP